MAMWPTIIGFSLWGLAGRFGQLGIQKRNLFSNPTGHFLAMGGFGYLGYWAHRWEERAAVILSEKEAELKERRRLRMEKAEQRVAGELGEASE